MLLLLIIIQALFQLALELNIRSFFQLPPLPRFCSIPAECHPLAHPLPHTLDPSAPPPLRPSDPQTPHILITPQIDSPCEFASADCQLSTVQIKNPERYFEVQDEELDGMVPPEEGGS
mmetsp:Transcript_25395/g.39818  ORF Transcript_25395/g.39818 Transcript_25395/m.39818 type:complete len:118 (-) Transcript_25395:71-424(-)